MKIWSIHPKYLNDNLLLRLWQDAIKAKKIISKKESFDSFPQLKNFSLVQDPNFAINRYLEYLYYEAKSRKISLKESEFDMNDQRDLIKIEKGQLNYEYSLLEKIYRKDNSNFLTELKDKEISSMPLFRILHSGIENWKCIKGEKK